VSKALIFRCAAVLALAPVTSFVYAPKISVAQELKTLKERLSDKASDDQRLDNCRVPPERRGTTPRPDCPTQSRPPMPAAQMDTPPTR
jgi:hypothetical protein